MAVLIPVMAVSQTVDHGGGIVSTQSGNNYKVTKKDTSQNGGTMTLSFGGVLKDGKRDGVWKLNASYNNYGGANGYYYTGTSTMTRTYKDGILQGPYSLIQNIKHRTGSYNRLRGVWVYGPFEDGSENISGNFVNGKPTGKWNVKGTMLVCSFTLDNGVPVGDAVVSKLPMGGGLNISFRDGYLTKWEPVSGNGWSKGYQWAPNEDLTVLSDQKECDLLLDLNFLSEYMCGSDFYTWIKNYPQNGSEEDFAIPYKTADKQSHERFFGNPPKSVIEEYEKNRRVNHNARLREETNAQDWQYKHEIDSLYNIRANRWNPKVWDLDKYFNIQPHKRAILVELFNENPRYAEWALKESSDTMVNDRVKGLYAFANDTVRFSIDFKWFNYINNVSKSEAAAYHCPLVGKQLYDTICTYFRPEVKEGRIVIEQNEQTNDFLSQINPTGALSVAGDIETHGKWREFLKRSYLNWAADSLPITEKVRDLYLLFTYVDEYNGREFKVSGKDASTVDLSDVRKTILREWQKKPMLMNFDKCVLYYTYKPGVGPAYHPVTDGFTITELLAKMEKNKKFRKLRETFPPLSAVDGN